MANPLFNNTGYSDQGNSFGPLGNLMTLQQNFNQFRAGLSGDPKAMVENLRASGQMSDQQFAQLSNMANALMPLLGGRR